MTRRTLPAALAALAALALAPTAAAAGLDGTAPAPGVMLPGMASAAAVDADPATWIVAARGDRAAGDRIARAAGARRIAGGAWEVARERARPLAAALRAQGLLDFAEPNRIARPAQAPDPLSAQAGWRDFVVGGAVAPPVTPTSPLIALVDTVLDASHPEIAGSNITTLGGGPLADFHGTATATVAAAPANGVGMLGIWPGARALNVPLPNGQQILCSDSARAIARAVRAGAAVINMSYGSPTRAAPRRSRSRRRSRPARSRSPRPGTSSRSGNPLEFPASLPHVLTVAAIGPDGKPTSFSNASAAIDLSAPGIGILTAVPAGFDPDGTADGFAPVSRHLVLGADGRGGRRVDPRRAAGPHPLPGRPGRAPRRTRHRCARLRELDRLRGAQPARRAGEVGRRRTTRWSPTTTSATSTAAPSGRSRRRSSTAGRRRRSPPRPTWPRTRSTSTA